MMIFHGYVTNNQPVDIIYCRSCFWNRRGVTTFWRVAKVSIACLSQRWQAGHDDRPLEGVPKDCWVLDLTMGVYFEKIVQMSSDHSYHNDPQWMIHQIPYFERRVVQTGSNPEIHLTRYFGVQMTRNDTQELAGFRPLGVLVVWSMQLVLPTCLP